MSVYKKMYPVFFLAFIILVEKYQQKVCVITLIYVDTKLIGFLLMEFKII